jgi:uncharacterized protein (TIGR03437 family)
MRHLIRYKAALIPAAFAILAALPARSQGTMTTVAGTGATTFSGDGGAANAAALNHPRGIAIDASGTMYIADVDNYRVRKVTPTGIISTVAGTGAMGASGDGGLAISAMFSDSMGVAVDGSGNLYIADSGNRRIRKVTPDGIVTTMVGIGVQGFSGDGGPATSAAVNRPTSLFIDSAGVLYFADSSNQRIRRVGTDGIITTVAGNGKDGFSGDGGPAVSASMSFPLGLTKDAAGNLYFADGNNNRIRKVTPGGIISTFAGGGAGKFGGDGGPATSASLNIPSDVAFDLGGNLYVADSGNNRVRKIDTSGTISTVAGTGVDGFGGDGGPASSAVLNYPWGVFANAEGAVFIADRVNSRIRSISGVPLGPPALQDNGIVNGATFSKNIAVAPGSIVTIFGSNLAAGATSASGAPYPTTLGSTVVTFNGIAAPLFYTSPGQINAQVPFEVPMGTASVQVKRGTATSSAGFVNVALVSPGIFIMDQGSAQGAILHSNYSLVSATNPARAGETLQIYATGLGPLVSSVGSGAPSPAANTISQPVVKIGNQNASVSYSGLAPGFAGLYQVNVVVPQGLAAGNQNIQITMNGSASNTATVAIAR